MKRAIKVALLLLLTGCARPSASAAIPASRPERLSTSGAGNSFGPVFSLDGQSVAYVSAANNLVTNDDLGSKLDVFVRHLSSGKTVLVSVDTNNLGGGNEDSVLPVLSSNGMVAAFESAASDLAPGDNNGVNDIFVRDFASSTTRLVSVSTNGFTSGNGRSFNPLLSQDGRYVIFESAASDLVPNDCNGTNDVFIRDLLAGTTALVSANMDGTGSADGPSHSPSISADGLFVAFVSHATNLVADAANSLGEIYVRDVAGGSNLWAMASHIPSTHEGSAALGAYRASEPILSADGRYVAFETTGGAVLRFDTHRPTNLVFEIFGSNSSWYYDNPRLVKFSGNASPLRLTPDGRFACLVASNSPNLLRSVMRVDFETLAVRTVEFCCPGGSAGHYSTNYGPDVVVVSTNHVVSPGATPMSSFLPAAPAFSADGQRVVFLNGCGTVPEGSGTLGLPLGLYLRDMNTNVSILIVSNLAGPSGYDMGGAEPALTADGVRVAWEGFSDGFVPDDLNRASDVFSLWLGGSSFELVSARDPERPALTALPRSRLNANALSANGRTLAFTALDSLMADDTNHSVDAFLHETARATNQLLSGGLTLRNQPGVVRLGGAGTNVLVAQLSADGREALFGVGVETLGVPPGSRGLYRRSTTTNGSADLITPGAGSSGMNAPTISRNGLEVAYQIDLNIMLRDYGAFATNPPLNFMPVDSVASIDDAGTATANAASINPLFNPDGRILAFLSRASNLTLDSAGNASFQLFVRDLVARNTRLISYATQASPAPGGVSTEQPSPGGATNAVFSDDGRYLFFQNGASNLVYRHDFAARYVETVTPHPDGLFTIYVTNYARVTNLLVCADCANPSVNADGRWVVYETRRGSNAVDDVFLTDVASGSNELVSVNLDGAGGGNGSSFGPVISYDARFVVFASRASDLVPKDRNEAPDIFVRDRFNRVTHCLSQNYLGTGTANRGSSQHIVSLDGRTVAFQSFASDLVPGDYNDTRDVFLVTLGGPDTDGDGLEDDWEMAYFNALDRDGSGDFDGDGATDASEFRAGTNPANDASILRALSLSVVRVPPEARAQYNLVVWSSTPGRSYRVEHKPGLNAAWNSVSGTVTAGAVTTSFGHLILNPTVGFYRVVLVE